MVTHRELYYASLAVTFVSFAILVFILVFLRTTYLVQHPSRLVVTTTVIVFSVLLLTVIGLRMALFFCRKWREPHPQNPHMAPHREFSSAPSIFVVQVEPVLERPAGAPPTYDEAQRALGLPVTSGTPDTTVVPPRTPTLTSVQQVSP